ncbi:hypothetical protein DFH09DRAFT_1340755 [Mycena vulgaris]|nr:hypothetical protein DFH09DRAFT_1340755 [Mycena vulgaris]
MLAQNYANNNVIGSILAFGELNTGMACLTLARLDHVVQLFPTLSQSQRQLLIVSRFLQWEICRAMLIIYHWIMVTGPALASLLLDAYVKDTLDSRFPDFSRLVQHIFLYVIDSQSPAPAQSHDKKAKLNGFVAPNPEMVLDSTSNSAPFNSTHLSSDPSLPHETASADVEALWPPHNLNLGSLPSDLYGLRPSQRGHKSIPMPKITGVGQLSKTVEYRNKAFKKCFLDLIMREFIMNSMVKIDGIWNSSWRRTTARSGPSPKRATTDREKAEARLVARCAILKCVVGVCGTEGIFASNTLHRLLVSPTALFPVHLSSDTRFKSALLKDEKATLQHLYNTVQKLVGDEPSIKDYAAKIGIFVHHHTLELQQGRTIQPAQILNPHIPLPREKPFDPAGAAGKAKRMGRPPIIAVTLEELLPASSTKGPIFFAKLGLVLREALNARHSLARNDNTISLQHILEGKNPSTGAMSDPNLDHYNPARAFSVNFQLLRKHMPPEKLTGPTGLSNLFTWMLTGQGFSTQPFLSKAKNFFFINTEDCIRCFETFNQNNVALMTEYLRNHPKAGEKDLYLNPSYVLLSDPKVWGQPSNQLSHNPTDKHSGLNLSLEEKFTPYFSPEVQRQWVDWLGPMAGRHPEKYKDVRQSWRAAIDFIRSFHFDGVKGTGLTTLQLANNLAFLGICNPPEVHKMVLRISENPGLGAFKALEALGFSIPDADPLLTLIAFQCVYDHLLKNLSVSDQELLGFGVIFVEHDTTFTALAETLRTEPPWILHQNLTDAKAFPFPLALNSAQLQQLIKDILMMKD